MKGKKDLKKVVQVFFKNIRNNTTIQEFLKILLILVLNLLFYKTRLKILYYNLNGSVVLMMLRQLIVGIINKSRFIEDWNR